MTSDQRSLVMGIALLLGDRLEPYRRHYFFWHKLRHCTEGASTLVLIFGHSKTSRRNITCHMLDKWFFFWAILILTQNRIHHTHSSDTPDQITQLTSLDPTLARSSTSNTPSLAHLSDDSAGFAANDAADRDHHIGRHHRVGKNLAVVLDDAEGAEYGIGANVDM